MQRYESLITGPASTELTVSFVTAERLFIYGDLHGVNRVDDLVPTGLTKVGSTG